MQDVHKKAMLVVRHLELGRVADIQNVLDNSTCTEVALIATEVTQHFIEMSQEVKLTYFRRTLERALRNERNKK